MSRHTYILFFVLLVITSCQKKKLEVKIEESQCKNFKIDSPLYTWIAPTNCSSIPLTWQVNVTVNYSGKKECIQKITVGSQYYDNNGNSITVSSATGSLMVTDAGVTMTDNTISFPFTFVFSNMTDANSFFTANLRIFVENEYGTKSNDVRLSIINKCVTPGSGSYTVKQTVDVNTSVVSITFWDDASEDGDIVNVYLNGMWVLENYSLKNAGETFNFPLNLGSNKLIVYAVNEGKYPPNTLAVSVNGGTKISLSPDLASGEAIDIDF